MARISLFQSAALAVLAAVGTMSVPALAQDQDQDRLEARAELREARQQHRAERQDAAPQQAPERQERPAAAPQQQAQDVGGGRNWNRGGGDGNGNGGIGRSEVRQQQQAAPQQRSAPDGGWRSQRADDGQRIGRNWENNGAVGRPAPAYRGETPQAPERGSANGLPHHQDEGTNGEWATQRNRTYSDPNRNSAYRSDRDRDDDTNHDRSGESWRDRQGDHNGIYSNSTPHNDYRDGRSGDNHRDQNYAYRNGYNSGSRDHNRWDHNNWRSDTRYNWSGYRTQHRDLYRAGRYFSPYSNYGYSRLSIGFFLNSGFYGNRYWINDPYQYRLPQAYGPYRWVRYYDDVLLVDIYSGEVVDVIHNFFW